KFQLAILQSALSFNAKRIVYCTCSKYQIENEDVIQQLYEMNPDSKNYDIIDPMPEWPYRGQGDYPFSSLCLRADYETTMTNGFFCCVLQRKQHIESLDGDQETKIDNNSDKNEKDNDNKTTESKTKKIKKKIRKSMANDFIIT
ncbi:williams-beuren syndrome critical region protein-like protein, partial [Euroglyphus maynei]